MKKTRALLMAILLGPFAGSAQTFHSINVNDGLSDNYVSALTRDHLGYMWFATLDGMNRYDGYTFKQYSLMPFGLNHNSFRMVTEDGGGNLWCIAPSNHFFYYNRETDTLSSHLSDILQPLGLQDEDIDNLFVDHHQNIWVSSTSRLERYNFKSGTLSSFPIASSCNSLASRDGLTFICLAEGEIRQLEPAQKTIHVPQEEAAESNRLFLDSKGRLWKYGSLSRGVACYHPSSGQWTSSPFKELLHGDYVSSVMEDGKGNIWLGTGSSGILVLNGDLSLDRWVETGEKTDHALPSNHINALYADPDGLIWIGMGKRGLAYICPEAIPIEKMAMDVPEDIGTIVEDRDGQIWIGYDGKGLVRFSPPENRIYSSKAGEIGSDIITGSYAADDGLLYFCTYGNGIFSWDGTRYRYLQEQDLSFRETVSRCRDLLEDDMGNRWIQTFNKGMVILGNDGSWINLTSDNSDLRSSSMTSMTYSQREETVFVSTYENLYAVPVQSKRPSCVYDLHNISNIFYDENGILWVGTTDGLYYIDRVRNKEPRHLSEKDGLAERHVQGIRSDRNGNLWVTSNRGVTNIFPTYDPVADSLRMHCIPYYKDDGIGDGQFTKNSLLCTSDGEMLMGCGGDIIRIRPEKFAPARAVRDVRILEIAVSDIPVQAHASRIEMKYSDRLALSVSTMDYRNLDKTRYEYSLDKNDFWTAAEGNRIRIATLSPGKHTLHVRATGPASFRSEEVLLDLAISPPFWRSTLAWIIYGMLALMLTGGIVQLILYRARKALAMQRMEMDEAKMQFFTNISHDIRTPLTLIMTPLSRLIKEHQGEPLEEDLQTISRSARMLMEEIDQLLDFRKLDKSKSAYSPSYGDLGQYVREICSSFRIMAADDTVAFSEEIPEGPLMLDFDKGKLQRVLYNLLSNAFKYNRKGGKVEVILHQENEEAVIQVKDTGIGISDKDKGRIFERFFQKQPSGSSLTGNGIGLHIVHEYVSLHGGTVSATDNEPSGTVFTVRIPIRETMKGHSSPEKSLDAMTGSGKPSVLVVEDNAPFRKFLLNYLSAKYDAVGAENGRNALDLMAEYPFDVIVSDILMPVMDGLELCRTVKNDIRHSHIPIILLSALQDQETIKKGLTEGADEYITKPFDIDILDIKLEKILNWTRENHDKFGTTALPASDITVSKLDEKLMEKAQEVIQQHLSDSDFSVEELSREIGLSRSGLYKKLTFITGRSPIEFIRIIRLRKGKDMLEEGETSVSQIAWSVGFSPKQFSKYFKEEYGCLPSDYVKHLKR